MGCGGAAWLLGAAALHSSHIKTFLVFPSQLLAFTRSVYPLWLAFISAHSAAGIPGREGLPSSFPSGFEAYRKHYHANLPLSLDSSLEWSLPGQCSSFYSSIHPCQLYNATVQSVSHSQIDTYPSSLECMATPSFFFCTYRYVFNVMSLLLLFNIVYISAEVCELSYTYICMHVCRRKMDLKRCSHIDKWGKMLIYLQWHMHK